MPLFSGLGTVEESNTFRWTFPRTRFDQLVTFAWKILIPLAFVNLLITAFVLNSDEVGRFIAGIKVE